MAEAYAAQPEQTSEPLSLEQLAQLLTYAGIPIHEWGQGDAKTVAHLLQEINEGETELLVTPAGEIERHVSVVWVDVSGTNSDNDWFHLVEDRQEFRDGRVRRRALDHSLGEKMKPGEDMYGAVERALREELGIEDVWTDHLRSELTQHAPSSYPGLKSEYNTHYFTAHIGADAFVAEGYTEVQADKTNYYIWQPLD